jgi:hypothetical protein
MTRPDLSAAELVLHNLNAKTARKDPAAEAADRPKVPKAEANPLPKSKAKTPARASNFKHTRTSPRGK